MAGEVQLKSYVEDESGTPVASATVEALTVGTTTVIASTTTDANGMWRFDSDGANSLVAADGYDIKITKDSSVQYFHYEDKMAYRRLEVAELFLRDSGDQSHLVGFDAPTVTGDRTITLPDSTGTLVHTGSTPVFTTDLTVNDDVDVTFGTGLDAQMRWSTGDASNHALVLALGDSNQALHITDKAAIATDWNVAADTHPTVYIHSNTTPATDYITIGAHDGTTAVINLVGGATLDFNIDGTTEAALTASLLDLQDNAITTTGVITGLTVEATGDTAAGDNAAMGYTATEGLVLTGQGSTNDVTIKNDADGVVIAIPTGTVTAVLAGDITVASGSIVSASGAISFGNENLSTTGTLGAGALTVTSIATSGDIVMSSDITLAQSLNLLTISGGEVFVNHNITTYAGGRIGFDGSGGHTYIHEQSDDDMQIFVGGVKMLGLDQDLLQLECGGYLNLHITDTDATVEGGIWYDASEDKLKFKTAAGVETITSS